MTLEEIDAIGLIKEAYNIEGIGTPECRSIFVDWALRLPQGIDAKAAISVLLRTYGTGADTHPMTAVLQAGLETPDAPKRRGGRKARVN